MYKLTECQTMNVLRYCVLQFSFRLAISVHSLNLLSYLIAITHITTIYICQTQIQQTVQKAIIKRQGTR